MAFLIGSFIFLKNVILLDLKSFINVDTQKHWFSSIISSSSLLSPFLFIESHVRSFSFTPTLTVISLIIALYFLLGGLLVIVRCWRPYKLYSKWSHWLSYQYKQQHQLSNRNNRLIIYFLQLQVARLQILTRCMCQSGISHLLISYPYIVDAIHTFQPYENNRLSSFFYYSNNIYPILYIISTWFLLHSLWSLISVEIQSLKGYSSAEEFIIKNINDFLRKDKIPVSITELDNIYTLESVFHILQSCQHRTLLRSSGSEQEGGSSSSSSNRRINLSNYLQYLALPTFSTKDATGVVLSLSDAVQHANQALLDIARDTLLHLRPSLLSRADTASETTASTTDMTSNASTTSEGKSEQNFCPNPSPHPSVNNRGSSSSNSRETFTRSPLHMVHSTAFWGRFKVGSRVTYLVLLWLCSWISLSSYIGHVALVSRGFHAYPLYSNIRSFVLVSSPLPAEILSLYNYTIGRINNSSNRNSNGNHSSAREESDQTDESQNKTTSVTEAISIDPLQSKSVFATINDFIDSSLQSLDRFLLRSIPSIMQDQYSLMYPAFLTFDHFIVSSNNHTVMHLLRSLRSTQSTTSSSSSNATTNSNFDMDINSGIHKGNKTTSKYSIKSGSATTGVSNEVNSSNTTVLFVSEHTIVNDESGQVFESEKDESTPKNVFDHMKKNLADWWKNVLHNVQKEAKDDTDMDSITRLSGSTTSAAGNSSKSMHENTDIETDSEFILSEKGNSDDSNDLTGTLLTRLLRTGSFNPFLLFRVMHVGYILYMLQCIHHLTYLFEFIIVVCAYVGSVLLYVLSSIW